MRFLLDESAEFRLAAFLQELGHDVTAIAHDYPAGLPDAEVLALARAEERILITNDRDFGELVFHQRLAHAGVIFFRLSDQALQTKILLLGQILTTHASQLDRFLVVDDRGVRVR
ncbi:MAG: DUF5615 family PIN-like protein [Chloroflexota bacterium]